MFNYYLANKEKVLLLFYFILETKVSLILSVNIRGPLFGLSRIVKWNLRVNSQLNYKTLNQCKVIKSIQI